MAKNIGSTWSFGDSFRGPKGRTKLILLIAAIIFSGSLTFFFSYIDRRWPEPPLVAMMLLIPFATGIAMLELIEWQAKLPALIRMNVRRWNEQRGTLGKTALFELDNQGVRISLADAHSEEFSWSKLPYCREVEERLLIQEHRGNFQWLPKDGFESEADYEKAVALIRNNVDRFDSL